MRGEVGEKLKIWGREDGGVRMGRKGERGPYETGELTKRARPYRLIDELFLGEGVSGGSREGS